MIKTGKRTTLRQQGIGLLELMLALAVATAIIFMAVRYFQVTNRSQKMSQAVAMIGEVQDAALTYSKRKTYNGDLSIAKLQSAGLLSDRYSSNPWGGALTVTDIGNKSQIRMLGVPNVACEEIALRLQQTINSSAGETATCKKIIVTVDYALY